MDEDQKELVKAGAEAAMAPFAKLIDMLFGGAVEEIGLGWRNKLAVRRQIREIKLYQKLQAAIDAAGFDPRAIPDRIWIPALQEALLEDDEDLQTIWAILLANAADPRQLAAVSAIFPTILKELSSRDVKFLDAIYARARNS